MSSDSSTKALKASAVVRSIEAVAGSSSLSGLVPDLVVGVVAVEEVLAVDEVGEVLVTDEVEERLEVDVGSALSGSGELALEHPARVTIRATHTKAGCTIGLWFLVTTWFTLRKMGAHLLQGPVVTLTRRWVLSEPW